ncbi:predicted protein [Sclerotinia sclerotiorum 1980 UF-70]|nr:predicted protein [Sclerotinia sclerotiorum 1980 UF-70]EDO01283.1 predicted protein [Sclerotinia sclerotiorum 1980 UF-70]
MPKPVVPEHVPVPPKHITPLKRKPMESKVTKAPPKSWKESLPIRGGSFEIERKPIGKTKEIISNKTQSPTTKPTPKSKPSETKPTLKSWKDSLPIRGGSIESERSTATIRDIFPNISLGPNPNKTSTNPPKPSPLKAKKPPENKSKPYTQIPTKSPNTTIVIKKKNTEMKIPGSFIESPKTDSSKRPTSREIKVPGAFIDGSFIAEKGENFIEKMQEIEEESIVRKKPQGVRPLKLRARVKGGEKMDLVGREKLEDGKITSVEKTFKDVLDEEESLYVPPVPRGP